MHIAKQSKIYEDLYASDGRNVKYIQRLAYSYNKNAEIQKSAGFL